MFVFLYSGIHKAGLPCMGSIVDRCLRAANGLCVAAARLCRVAARVCWAEARRGQEYCVMLSVLTKKTY